MIPVYKINLPEYTIEKQPDFDALGKRIDATLRENYMGQDIVIRALGSQDHPNKTTEELINIIQETGSDRYDPNKKGDRYENIEGKHIDFFALGFTITETGEYFKFLLEPFYTWPEKPIRIDIGIVYDLNKIEAVEHQYEGREGEIKRDGYIFKDPNKKSEAVKGIIHIQ